MTDATEAATPVSPPCAGLAAYPSEESTRERAGPDGEKGAEVSDGE